MPRMKEYTQIGIGRLKCIRCGSKAEHQWTICADGNQYRPMCVPCDVELNELVLKWANIPDWEIKIAKYKEKYNYESIN